MTTEQQTAIAFYVWINSLFPKVYAMRSENNWVCYQPNKENEYFTTEQILELFEKRQTNDHGN